MSYIGKNIKRIRAVKKLSQAAFAELFALARPSVGAYEEGRSEPKIETIIAIARYFGLSTDALLRKELTVNELYSLDIFKGEFDPTQLPPALGKSSGFEQNGNLPTSSQKRQTGAGIPLISKSMRLEYIVNLQNRDFINRLQIVALPEAQPGKTLAFEHSGGEMLTDGGGLRDGDILTAVAVSLEKANRLREGQVYIIITARELLTRRLRKLEAPAWIFEADNPAVPPLPIEAKDILELWEVKGCWTTQLQPPSLLDHKLLLLEEELRQLKERVSGLESK
ncbi:XRE family transcriptional regulator [Cesiribacter andamanensis]|uniref:Helix-turn-helix protein n=1 Tax=Cesiribacter andamanensis AMV16 TaxID=1279009 RepID=M7NU97_9BACT|nr:LexA family transcriptional regulator [Cesiribacter andamanensis]EMR02064.1 helix-turn-helix protein [Cesiribacter andamanensis AMV16]